MLTRKPRIVTLASLLLAALFLSGCAGSVKNMRTVAPENVMTSPADGMARVVFMRPSGMGFAVQSSVFEIENDQPTLVGIVAAKKKVSHQVPPGNKLFMVVGESADFMSAELEPNKTYYALVTPRMGLWKARFSLAPVHAEKLNSSEFNEWLNSCEWVEMSPESKKWESENITSIQEKQNEYYAKWMSKNAAERPKLLPQDGQ